jgi:hypothetical protein
MLQPSVFSDSAGKFTQQGTQFFYRKVRPQCFGEEQLRVSKLPRQKVGEAEIAAGADTNVRIGEERRIEMAGKIVFADPVPGFTKG